MVIAFTANGYARDGTGNKSALNGFNKMNISDVVAIALCGVESFEYHALPASGIQFVHEDPGRTLSYQVDGVAYAKMGKPAAIAVLDPGWLDINLSAQGNKNHYIDKAKNCSGCHINMQSANNKPEPKQRLPCSA